MLTVGASVHKGFAKNTSKSASNIVFYTLALMKQSKNIMWHYKNYPKNAKVVERY